MSKRMPKLECEVHLDAPVDLQQLELHGFIALESTQVRLTAVSPAVVEAPIYEGFIDREKIHSALQRFNDFHPIGGVGQPKDVPEVICFLLSEKASWVTGAIWEWTAGSWQGGISTLDHERIVSKQEKSGRMVRNLGVSSTYVSYPSFTVLP
jgi:Enoyl-(Acyl carrier protein) reductase